MLYEQGDVPHPPRPSGEVLQFRWTEHRNSSRSPTQFSRLPIFEVLLKCSDCSNAVKACSPSRRLNHSLSAVVSRVRLFSYNSRQLRRASRQARCQSRLSLTPSPPSRRVAAAVVLVNLVTVLIVSIVLWLVVVGIYFDDEECFRRRRHRSLFMLHQTELTIEYSRRVTTPPNAWPASLCALA